MEDKELRRILDNADDCEIYGIWVLTERAGRTTEQIARLEKHLRDCKRCQEREQFMKTATPCQKYQKWLNITDYWLTKGQVAELDSHSNSCNKCRDEEQRVAKAAQCKLYRMWIWGSLDEELEPELDKELKEHLARCLICSSAYEEARALKTAVRKVELPQPPKELDANIRKSLEKAEQSRYSQLSTLNSQLATRNSVFYRFRYAVGAAALVLIALLVTIPTSSPLIPEVLARSAELHDQYLNGDMKLDVSSETHGEVQEYFAKNVGGDVSVPILDGGTKLMGGCGCKLAKDNKTIPWIIYKDKGGTPLSLFLLSEKISDIPAGAKHTYNGRTYYKLRVKNYNLVICNSGNCTHLWVSQMNEDEMLSIILSTQQGRNFFRGERIALSGINCKCCCSAVLSCIKKLDGVEDADIDMASRELVVSYKKDKLRLEDIIEAIKKAGYSAEEKK